MKNLLYTFAAFILFTSLIFSQPDTLTILHVNDTHSCLSSFGPRGADLEGTQGGISRAATIIGMTKMSDPNVTLLHSGDAFIGDLFFNVYFGAAEFQLMNSLGFDVMSAGNHEFDLTPSTLLAALQSSFLPGEGFPIISSNLILEDTSLAELKNYITPFTIVQKGNIKIGLFSLLTPETNLLSLPSPAVVDTNIFPIAAAMVDTLLSQNCNLIICLSHLGFLYDQALAENIPGIHVMAGGHDHYLFEEPVAITNPLGKTTWIIQDGAFYSSISKMQLLIDNGEVSLLNFSNIPLDNNVSEEPSVKAVVANLIAGIEAQYLTPFYTSQMGISTDYFKEVADSLMFPGLRDTPIGNLVTDAYLSVGQTDIAITVGGSTAQPLYAGYLVPADAFRVVGYGFNEVNGLGFRLETFDILGIDLWTALEKSLAYIEYNDEFFVQVSGMFYKYNPTKDVGERLISVLINGIPLDITQTYSVTTNEFLVAALSDPNFFNIPISNTYLFNDLSEFEVLYGYLSTLGTISPIIEGRVTADIATNYDDESSIPKHFNLEQNYPNPFNPTTTINYSIPEAGNVGMKVYDVLGNEVATLVNEAKAPGNYVSVFDASSLASGVYIYTLRTNNFVQTKKMILMK